MELSLSDNNKQGVLKMIDLKKERKKLGLTQVQMAKKIGVKYSPYVSWEAGRAEPNFENNFKIEKFLKKNIKVVKNEL